MQNRRNFLKSSLLVSGAFAFSPAYNLFANPGVSSTPKRFVFIRKSNGLRPHEVALPTLADKEKNLESKKESFVVDLDKHELPKWMNALAPHKADLAVIQGLSCKMIENGHYSYSSIMGVYHSNRNSLSAIKRATIDFELAKLYPSPFGHVELSLTGDYSSFRKGIVSGYSAPAANQRNYCYADPETAYNELFKSVTNSEALNSDNKMLKYLQQEETVNSQRLSASEKAKLSTHVYSLEAIQERNVKVQKMSSLIANHLPKLDPIHLNGGEKASTPEKQKAMTDILIAALATGLTNVVTYTIDELSTPIKGLPGNEGDLVSLHEIGHEGGYGGVPAVEIREKVRIGHMAQMARIAEALKKLPEGNGTMFDNTMIMYFPEGGETHHGTGTESPWIVLSGKNCHLDIVGRYTRLPYLGNEGHKTIGNWYTTLLNVNGNPIDHYGDLDLEMSRKKLNQLGAIKQFMKV